MTSQPGSRHCALASLDLGANSLGAVGVTAGARDAGGFRAVRLNTLGSFQHSLTFAQSAVSVLPLAPLAERAARPQVTALARALASGRGWTGPHRHSALPHLRLNGKRQSVTGHGAETAAALVQALHIAGARPEPERTRPERCRRAAGESRSLALTHSLTRSLTHPLSLFLTLPLSPSSLTHSPPFLPLSSSLSLTVPHFPSPSSRIVTRQCFPSLPAKGYN
jgi:hypothetical protein